MSSLTVQDPIEPLADTRWPPPLELARSRRASYRSVLAAARAYVALTKPNIIWLLLITTVPAMSVAAGGWPSTRLVVATLAGEVETGDLFIGAVFVLPGILAEGHVLDDFFDIAVGVR